MKLMLLIRLLLRILNLLERLKMKLMLMWSRQAEYWLMKTLSDELILAEIWNGDEMMLPE